MYLSYELGVAKPNPEIFKRVVEAENLNPSETLFVDDGAANIEVAKSLGFRTLLIKEGEDFRHYPFYRSFSDGESAPPHR